MPAEDEDYQREKLRASNEHHLEDRSIIDLRSTNTATMIPVQILTIFPGMVLQQIRNTIAVRVLRPRRGRQERARMDPSRLDGDDAAMRELAAAPGHLIGAAGYISMEDGCVGGSGAARAQLQRR